MAAPSSPLSVVDWDLAAATARRLIRPGPAIGSAEARDVVEDLRRLAEEAEEHVITYTGLHPVGARPVAVVDRVGWVESNISALGEVLAPILTAVVGKKPPKGVVGAVGSRVTGVQVGTAFGYLASKVLGQYEVFRPAGDERLSLVAPNIVATERMLGVDPHDFRLWVCVHEQTHRVQFTAVPWMRTHLESLVAEFAAVSRLDPEAVLGRLREASSALVAAVRKPDPDGTPASPPFLELIQTPEARVVLDRVTALMTLLEGHADQVMDAVGPGVIPTVETIRVKFEERRKDAAAPERLLRSLLGFDAKLEQYRAGGSFVRSVVDRVGVAGFNRVWTAPDTLPTRAEIADHTVWLDRVVPDLLA